MELPAYIQNIRNALMRNGMEEGRATATAINSCKRWAAGGGNVSAEVRKAATSALAQLKAKESRAHSSHSTKQHTNAISHLRELANTAHSSTGQFTSPPNAGSATTKPKAPAPVSRKILLQAATLHVQANALRQQAQQLQTRINGLKALITQQTLAQGTAAAAKTASGTGTKTKSANASATVGSTNSQAQKSAASRSASSTAKKSVSAVSSLKSNLAQYKSLTMQRDSLLNQATALDQRANSLSAV
jgi:uncharacterized protein YdaT